MNELAVKSSNGTNSESDRKSIQEEIDQLVTEIDRVSETTKFNETYLLKGDGSSKAVDASATVAGKTSDIKANAATGNIYQNTISTTLGDGTEDTATITYKDMDGKTRSADITFKVGSNSKSTAESLAKAINDDAELSKIFKATSDDNGMFKIESRRNGDSIDNTTDKIDSIALKSSGTNSTQKSTLGTAVEKAATGESYDISLKGLTSGSSITIDGKTFTYSTTASDKDANTFKTLTELQNLLGDDYEVSASVAVKQVTEHFVGSTDGTAIADTPASSTEVVFADVKQTGTGFTSDLSSIGRVNADVPEDGAFVVGSTLPSGDKQDNIKYTDADTADKEVKLRIAKKADTTAKDTLTLDFQVGADTSAENKISVDIDTMSAKGLGINGLRVDGKDSTNADLAVNTIAKAISKVSAQRSALGAVQNRLEHTIKNLDNVVENTTSAESQIRDTDMATEMVKYSNNNILAQAGTSMLAQANQANQSVLSLLG